MSCFRRIRSFGWRRVSKLFVAWNPLTGNTLWRARPRFADLHADLTERGHARALQLTWDQTAEQTVAVYREVLDRTGGRAE